MNYRGATTEAGCNRLYFTTFFAFLHSELRKTTLLLSVMRCLISSGCTLEKAACCSKIEKGGLTVKQNKLFDSSNYFFKIIKL